MSKFRVTKIEVSTTGMVEFLNGTTLVRMMSRSAPLTSTFVTYDTTSITFILPDNEQFSFDVYAITQVGGTAYTALTPFSAPADIASRVKDIYTVLSASVFESSSTPSGSSSYLGFTEYRYAAGLAAGEFTLTSGQLFANFTSDLGQDFSDFFHHLSSGCWIYFVNKEDRAEFHVYEVSSYAAVSGLASWSATLIDESAPFADASYEITFDNAGSGSGSQNLQQVLDTGSTLNKDNTVNGNGNSWTWSSFVNWILNATTEIRLIVTNTTSTYLKLFNNRMEIGTPNVTAGTATAGLPLTLVTAGTGASEFSTIGRDALSDSTAYLPFVGAAHNPTDTTPFYMGTIYIAPTNTANRRRIYFSTARTITAFNFQAFTSGAGSGESVGIYIRVNNTTDYAMSTTMTWNAGSNTYNLLDVTGLSIAIAAGDFIEIKVVPPIWATNPTGVSYTGAIEYR